MGAAARCALLLGAALVARASKEPPAQRGFLLAATKTPVSQMRNGTDKRDNLGAMLRDVCATSYPTRLVVRSAAEAASVRRYLPCAAIDVRALEGEDGLGARGTTRRRATMIATRLFKVGALAASLPLWPGGTLYLDNDIALRRDAVDELFGHLDAMKRSHKAVGLAESHICIPPSHKAHGVPKGFCERNGGLIYFAPGNASRAIVDDWLAELERHTSSDGHDQMPLRVVLWRHKQELFDLPAHIQIRGKRRGDPCKPRDGKPPLLWHVDHEDRLKWARRHRKSGRADEAYCGFLP